MIVTRSKFLALLETIFSLPVVSLDSETTGLKPYGGDKIFSLIIGAILPGELEPTAFYFNFKDYEGVEEENILGGFHRDQLAAKLRAFRGKAYLSNAKYDMHMLWADWEVELSCEIFCTQAQGRVAYNDHILYGLEPSLERIGLAKSDAVKEWLKANGGTSKVAIEGKDAMETLFHFDRAPFDMIVPYGESDAIGTYKLGQKLEADILKASEEQAHLSPPRTPLLVSENEKRLTKSLWRMERDGIYIDKAYTRKAFEYEQGRLERLKKEFYGLTEVAFMDSGNLFEKVFASEKERWGTTKKGNSSFKSDVLALFHHPAAKLVLDIRDAKSKSDFYTNFLRFADSEGFVHGTYNQGGTRHGRMSASDPNTQNFSNPDEEDGEVVGDFQVRGCVIPPPDYYIASLDYDSMEYRFLLEMAARLQGHTGRLLEMVRDGHKVHHATAELCGSIGVKVHYKEAKISNFLTIYGGGEDKLADSLRTTPENARRIQGAIFRACPEILLLRNTVKATARDRGYIVNWLGRRSYFPGGKGTHKALNYMISGGCADVNKIFLNNASDYLHEKKTFTKLVMSIHDEAVLYVHKREAGIESKIKEFMETAFEAKYLPLTTSLSTSDKNLAMV